MSGRSFSLVILSALFGAVVLLTVAVPVVISAGAWAVALLLKAVS